MSLIGSVVQAGRRVATRNVLFSLVVLAVTPAVQAQGVDIGAYCNNPKFEVNCSNSQAGQADAGVQFSLLRAFKAEPRGPRVLTEVRGASRDLFGMAEFGGTFDRGAVFKLTRAGVLTTLHSFRGPDGAIPRAGLLEASDGNFYGVTEQGGVNDQGTVFRMTPGGQVTTLHSFNGTDGAFPRTNLIQASDGQLYGVAQEGGEDDSGTIFRISIGGTFTQLHSFGGTSGSFPQGALIQAADGNLYGVTGVFNGGAAEEQGFRFGTIFRIATTGASFTTLYALVESDGALPVGLVEAGDGNFYGANRDGGPNNHGTIFRVTPAGVYTTIHEMDANDGDSPLAPLILGENGDLFGTTAGLLAGSVSTAFRVTTAGALTVLRTFTNDAVEGRSLQGPLTRGSDGNLYGATLLGGPSNAGVFFRVAANGGNFAVVRSLGDANGQNPSGALVQAGGGDFFGLTEAGGGASVGTFYRLTTSGQLTTVASFGNATGAFPQDAVALGNDGNFYGVTASFTGGGSDAAGFRSGTVFRVSPSGSIVTLHAFAADGSDGFRPEAGLVQASDGNFYGSTRFGGAGDNGTLFRVTPAGVLTTLHSFADGGEPTAALVEAADGNLYGVAAAGGSSNHGSVFRLTPAGTVTTLHSFTGSADGERPTGALMQGSDGNLYGTTEEGGSGDLGTIFRITTAGVLTTMHSFGGDDGSLPQSALMEATDGTIYGTTSAGGAFGFGTVFKMSTAGTVNTLFSFGGDDGAFPAAALIQATDGNFYGAAASFGQDGGGTLFKIGDKPPPPSQPSGGGGGGALNLMLLLMLSALGLRRLSRCRG